MKFLVPNYSCLQNPSRVGYRLLDPRSLCPQLNLLNPPPPNKIPGYATDAYLRPLNNHQHFSPLLLYTCKIYVWTRLRSSIFWLGYCFTGTPCTRTSYKYRTHHIHTFYPRVDPHVSIWNLPASFSSTLTSKFQCWQPIQIHIKNQNETWTSETGRTFYHHHHHKHQGLYPLICSVSKVTTALSNVS